jgi:hypothetical protein
MGCTIQKENIFKAKQINNKLSENNYLKGKINPKQMTKISHLNTNNDTKFLEVSVNTLENLKTTTLLEIQKYEEKFLFNNNDNNNDSLDNFILIDPFENEYPYYIKKKSTVKINVSGNIGYYKN